MWRSVDSKSALHPPRQPQVAYATDCSKGMVLVLFLFCVALWFLLRGVSCWVLSCPLFLCIFSSFSIVITSLGEQRAGLCASRAFVWLFCMHWFFVLFLFHLESGVGYGLRLWYSLDFSINFFDQKHLSACSCLLYLRPPKNSCVFQVSQSYLGFRPNPKHFIVNCEQNIVKFAEK